MDEQKKYLNHRVIFLILGAVILVEVIVGLRILTQPTSSPTPSTEVQSSAGATITLSSSRNQYKVGETIPVLVAVSTGGRSTDGTDLLLKFDPKLVEATASGFKKGEIYSEYPSFEVDNKTGVIRISGIAAASSQGFSGEGIFATLDLKAKQAGNTSLMVDFQKDKTTDTNIIETGSAKDILEQVYNLDLIIR